MGPVWSPHKVPLEPLADSRPKRLHSDSIGEDKKAPYEARIESKVSMSSYAETHDIRVLVVRTAGALSWLPWRLVVVTRAPPCRGYHRVSILYFSIYIFITIYRAYYTQYSGPSNRTLFLAMSNHIMMIEASTAGPIHLTLLKAALDKRTWDGVPCRGYLKVFPSTWRKHSSRGHVPCELDLEVRSYSFLNSFQANSWP